MSLHAQLAPEAQQALAKQQRNITVTSILISVLSCILITISLLYWWLEPMRQIPADIVTYVGPNQEKPEIVEPTMKRSIKNNPSSPSNRIAKNIAANVQAEIAIPVVDVNVPDPSTEMGNGDEFGIGSGEGFGDGRRHIDIPIITRQRCSKEDRLDRIAKSGGTPECEDAVVKSLRWLKKTQNADGSWTGNRKVSMTAFALLAYLGHCEHPNTEEFGDSVTAAISYLVNIGMNNDGKLADDTKDKHWPYEHAIATYALAEATTFCQALDIPFPRLKETTKAAGDWILEHQHSSGAWDYAYDMSGKRGGDTSIALWHIQALKACKHTQLWDNKDFKTCIKNALNYLRNKQAPDGGVGYTSAAPSGEAGYTMTGGAMLAFQMWGKSHDAVVRKANKYVRNHAKLDYKTADSDLYRHYYHVQAMLNRGGTDWEYYNNLFRDQLLNNQNQDGSYRNVGGGAKVNAVAPAYQGNSAMATHYRTCLATLMLETYYRFLPTGQKAIR